MKHYDKLIFVSESDTATGPMAEAILQREFMLEDILITSKGLVVLFPEPVNPKAEAVLVSHSLSMKDHISDPLTEDDFDDRTLVLTIDTQQRDRLLKEYPGAKNVFALSTYIQAEEEVLDPYGGSLAGYNQCYEMLHAQILRLAAILSAEEMARQTEPAGE